MSAYLSYMKAFGSDLGQVAVWEPGAHVELGDYGEIRHHRWERLGSVWELMSKVEPKFREYDTATLERLSLGSAELFSENAGSGYSGLAGKFSVSIRFSKEHSVFVRAQKCETKTLARVQKLAEQLALSGDWKRSWSFVSAVREAERFLVLIGSTGGSEIRVSASSNELLAAFAAGEVTVDSGIQFSGSETLQFLGCTGAIHMSLTKIGGNILFGGATAARTFFAEGKAGATEVFVEDFEADEFLKAIAPSEVSDVLG